MATSTKPLFLERLGKDDGKDDGNDGDDEENDEEAYDPLLTCRAGMVHRALRVSQTLFELLIRLGRLRIDAIDLFLVLCYQNRQISDELCELGQSVLDPLNILVPVLDFALGCA